MKTKISKSYREMTVTVGIPARNEEANIGFLLMSLLQQNLAHVILKEIIVVSDAGTDKTASIVRSIRDSRIKLIEHKTRRGLNKSQNEIVKKATGDVLVLLDGDVLPATKNFLQDITSEFKKQSSLGVVSVKLVPLRPRSFIERIMVGGHYFKSAMYRRINQQDNIYLCHGAARALSRQFYVGIRWPENCPEDAYSYLLCKKRGLTFYYNSSASVVFRAPATISDQVKQTKRFLQGMKLLERIFDRKVVTDAYKIPSAVVLRSLVKFALTQPITTVTYIVLQMYIRYINKERYRYLSVYEASSSTKKLMTAFFPAIFNI